MRAVGIDEQPFAIVGDDDAVVPRKLRARNFAESLSRGP